MSYRRNKSGNKKSQILFVQNIVHALNTDETLSIWSNNKNFSTLKMNLFRISKIYPFPNKKNILFTKSIFYLKTNISIKE